MNLKNNTPRMHHITPFWDEKFLNFLGRGTAPQTPLVAYCASILASSALDLRPPLPECSSGVDAHGDVNNTTRKHLSSSREQRIYRESKKVRATGTFLPLPSWDLNRFSKIFHYWKEKKMSNKPGVFNLWSADPRWSAGSFQGVRGQPQKNWKPVAF